ncbi:MAG: hypothetical protein LHW59_08490, partial [Candidatus Cloacimonetes bacterium]|nr:hypothetical protein [Candidatus Cloacimonadota bacterium]
MLLKEHYVKTLYRTNTAQIRLERFFGMLFDTDYIHIPDFIHTIILTRLFYLVHQVYALHNFVKHELHIGNIFE